MMSTADLREGSKPIIGVDGIGRGETGRDERR